MSSGDNRPGSSKKALPELPDGVRRGLAGITPPTPVEADPVAELPPVQPLPWSLDDTKDVKAAKKSAGGRSGKSRRSKGGRAGAATGGLVTGGPAGSGPADGGTFDAFEGRPDGMPEWAAGEGDADDSAGPPAGISAPSVRRSSEPAEPSGTSSNRRRPGTRATRRFGDRRPTAPADPELDRSADPHSAARTILLDKLSGQPRTRAELAGLLAEREISDEVADEVLDRFTEVGLIDDAAFAAAWVESRHRGRGLGKRALAQELRRRGVDDELTRDALEELDPDQEEATARALVRKKLRSMRSLERQVAMRRLIGMLARKGYPGSLAMTIVKQELDASDEELPLLNDSGLEAD
ncbi:regulatory protein RecX [Kribbella sp. CA-294648]|uniref:regulatory protein RecX n=1 Tax=Kribbella sp. CA-294648 TaxID=3239948 RepID=UPI003D8DB8DF